MAFPGPGYTSPRKKEDLKVGKGIIETSQYMTKEQKKLYENIGEAVLEYCRDKALGSLYIDDVKMMNSSKGNGWIKMEFYFKVVK